MSVQSEFINFYNRIKLDYNVNSELASKRDILVGILKDSKKLPRFEVLNQGSYSMYIGTEPLEGKEYDIDVGLRFNVAKSSYEPMELKKIIQEILDNHTDYGAVIKKPCVTDSWCLTKMSHWKVCECGEKCEQGGHQVDKWEKDNSQKNTETGTCKVCGFKCTRKTVPVYPGTVKIEKCNIGVGAGKFPVEYKVGDEAVPAISIRNGGSTLKGLKVKDATEARDLICEEPAKINGVHFVYYLTNNTNAAEKGKITIVGVPKNGYESQVTKEFTIQTTKLSGFSVKGLAKSYEYTGADIQPGGVPGETPDAPSGFYITKKINGTSVKYEKGVSFKVSYKKNIKKGTATIILTGINNCSGTLKKTFTIKPANVKKFDVDDIPTQEFKKSGAKPKVTVTDPRTGYILKQGKDYTLSYANNKKRHNGENSKKNPAPTVIIKGKGNYSGTKKVYFAIE